MLGPNLGSSARVGVVCEDVSFSYTPGTPGTEVLSHVSLHALPGTVTAFLGPSGSGKSTLLGLLGGFLRPTSGKIRWDGNDDPRRVAIGWIQQTTNVFGRRSARSNVAMSRLREGKTVDQSARAADEVLGLVGLAGMEHRIVNSLSGGEVQRVVIARALFGHPGLLLADEPTGQLDRQTTEIVADALMRAARHVQPPVPVIIATHDTVLASKCDHRFEVADGRVWAVDGVS